MVVNSVLSISQEDRAQQALEELQKLSSPMAQALRDGRQTRVQASDLVPGDIIYLEAGDLVPADARLLSSSRLQTDESTMTGESAPGGKATRTSFCPLTPLWVTGSTWSSRHLGHRRQGHGGGLRHRRRQPDGPYRRDALRPGGGHHPLQARMAEISQKLSFLCLCVCAVMFGLGLLQGKKMLDMFLTAVSGGGRHPEGLPAIVTIVLALGVGRMARRGAIVKKLPAVETLGCAEGSSARTRQAPSPKTA